MILNYPAFKRSVLILFILTFFLSFDVQATNGMKLIGLGPIQRSMGGVSIAIPLDSATIMTNPAGISTFSRRIDFGVSLSSRT
mgnify:CR=1 FL=1